MDLEKIIILSIVIPTKNRQKYLLSLLDKILSTTNHNFEVVIQDNSDSDFLRHEIISFADNRINYEYIQEPLTIDLNCDLAVSRAKGHYVCMLGDDDGILIDESINMLRKALINQIDAVLPGSIYYAWPGVYSKNWGEVGGKVYYSNFNSHILEIDPLLERNKVLAEGGSQGLGRMLRLYHGFVARSVLDRLYMVTSTYFPGPSPDMANAAGVAGFLNKCIYIDFPFIIAGHSPVSGGGSGSAGKHKGEVASQKHLPNYTVKSWIPQVPFFWSGPTIYAQSICHSQKLLSEYNQKNVNFPMLYAVCLIYHSDYWKAILKAIVANDESILVLYLRIFYYLNMVFIKRLRSFIKNLIFYKSNISSSDNAETISTAIDMVAKHYKSINSLYWSK